MKIGDRILAMNGMNITQCTLAEAQSVLAHAEDRLNLLVEYDVSVMGGYTANIYYSKCICHNSYEAYCRMQKYIVMKSEVG